jgi:hypothetical protein
VGVSIRRHDLFFYSAYDQFALLDTFLYPFQIFHALIIAYIHRQKQVCQQGGWCESVVEIVHKRANWFRFGGLVRFCFFRHKIVPLSQNIAFAIFGIGLTPDK